MDCHRDEPLLRLFDCFACPLCGVRLRSEEGFAPGEAVWMHEYECQALLLASGGAAYGAA